MFLCTVIRPAQRHCLGRCWQQIHAEAGQQQLLSAAAGSDARGWYLEVACAGGEGAVQPVVLWLCRQVWECGAGWTVRLKAHLLLQYKMQALCQVACQVAEHGRVDCAACTRSHHLGQGLPRAVAMDHHGL
jgi:hypothetical protein